MKLLLMIIKDTSRRLTAGTKDIYKLILQENDELLIE